MFSYGYAEEGALCGNCPRLRLSSFSVSSGSLPLHVIADEGFIANRTFPNGCCSVVAIPTLYIYIY